MAAPGQRSQVRDSHVRVAVRHVPQADAQQLALGILLRVCDPVPVHVGHRHGLGPSPMVRRWVGRR